jgi:hypothetical protein
MISLDKRHSKRPKEECIIGSTTKALLPNIFSVVVKTMASGTLNLIVDHRNSKTALFQIMILGIAVEEQIFDRIQYTL